LFVEHPVLYLIYVYFHLLSKRNFHSVSTVFVFSRTQTGHLRTAYVMRGRNENKCKIVYCRQ